MSESLTAWLDTHAERANGRQRAQAETTKLIATLLFGTATTFVATAMQVAQGQALNRWGPVLLALTLAATIAVILLDRFAEADAGSIVLSATATQLDAAATLRRLRVAALACVDINDGVIARMRVALLLQAGVAIGTIVVATANMLELQP